jgi:hypothetical protein
MLPSLSAAVALVAPVEDHTPRAEAKAWNRRMNRARVKIAWGFDRKSARRKFGYKMNSFMRSQT